MANQSEIYGLLKFLVSKESDYVTGQNLFVDGGFTSCKAFLKINNLKIGEDYEPVIIPEIGINHNGNLSAFKLIDSAKSWS